MIRTMLFAAIFATSPVWAAKNATICVYDVMGAAGETASFFRDYSLVAKAWDVDFVTRVYTDEKEAQRAYNNKACQAMVVPDFAAKPYNHLTGSFSAVGL